MTAIDVASEIFAITDVLSSQPMLRRSLSEPSASAEQRRELAQKLFGGRVGGEAMQVLSEVVGKSWRKPDLLVRGLEREGVVSAFRGAEAEGQLERVTSELHALGRAAKENGELTAVLRDPSYEFDAKRSLVDRLLGDAAHPVTALDQAMYDLLQQAGAPRIVVANKVDKVGRSKWDVNRKGVLASLPGLHQDALILFSAETRQGVEELWKHILAALSPQ